MLIMTRNLSRQQYITYMSSWRSAWRDSIMIPLPGVDSRTSQTFFYGIPHYCHIDHGGHKDISTTINAQAKN